MNLRCFGLWNARRDEFVLSLYLQHGPAHYYSPAGYRPGPTRRRCVVGFSAGAFRPPAWRARGRHPPGLLILKPAPHCHPLLPWLPTLPAPARRRGTARPAFAAVIAGRFWDSGYRVRQTMVTASSGVADRRDQGPVGGVITPAAQVGRGDRCRAGCAPVVEAVANGSARAAARGEPGPPMLAAGPLGGPPRPWPPVVACAPGHSGRHALADTPWDRTHGAGPPTRSFVSALPAAAQCPSCGLAPGIGPPLSGPGCGWLRSAVRGW